MQSNILHSSVSTCSPYIVGHLLKVLTVETMANECSPGPMNRDCTFLFAIASLVALTPSVVCHPHQSNCVSLYQVFESE